MRSPDEALAGIPDGSGWPRDVYDFRLRVRGATRTPVIADSNGDYEPVSPPYPDGAGNGVHRHRRHLFTLGQTIGCPFEPSSYPVLHSPWQDHSGRWIVLYSFSICRR